MSNLTEKELAKLVMQWAMMTMKVKSTDEDSDPALGKKPRPVEFPEN